ncbi:MAG: hypothetical protein WC812_02655 [Candidatus Pacearchaeota archaeon]|jgi:hypothetical protein
MKKIKYGNNLPGRINYQVGEIAEIKNSLDRVEIKKVVRPNLFGYFILGLRKYKVELIKNVGSEYFKDERAKLIVPETRLEKITQSN